MPFADSQTSSGPLRLRPGRSVPRRVWKSGRKREELDPAETRPALWSSSVLTQRPRPRAARQNGDLRPARLFRRGYASPERDSALGRTTSAAVDTEALVGDA